MNRKRYYLLIIVQIVFLLSMAGSYYAADFFGEEMILKTEPIYVGYSYYENELSLNYEINSLSKSLWRGTDNPEDYRHVFVELAEAEDGVYQAVAIYPDQAEVAQGHLVLKGRLSSSWDEDLYVIYGLERYFASNEMFDALREEGDQLILTVSVQMAPWGQVKINDIINWEAIEYGRRDISYLCSH